MSFVNKAILYMVFIHDPLSWFLFLQELLAVLTVFK